MKKIFLIILFAIIYIFGAEFKITSFERDRDDRSATNEETKLLDVNGNVCSILKIYTNLKDVSFESNLLEKSILKNEGEYWVYLPKKTKRLKFKKESIMPLTYTFPEKLKESTVYFLKLTAEGLEKKIEDISITIETTPPDANIFIDGVDKGKIKSLKTSVGKHELKIVKDRYHTIQKTIEVSADKTLFEYVLEIDIDCIFVEGGSFQMGSNDGGKFGVGEKPIHSVTVEDFYIGKTEVTQLQYKAVMGNNPSLLYRDNNPETLIRQIKIYCEYRF